MKKVIPFLILFLILGCEDKKEDKILEANALLHWTGDYSVDGCGFFIVISDNEYKPEDEGAIDDSFKVNGGVEVTSSPAHSRGFFCGRMGRFGYIQ